MSNGGPWVQAATFCDKALQEADGTLSLIRMIDQITVAVNGPGAPVELPPGRVSSTLVVMLKSDEAQGRHPLTIRGHLPSGQSLPDQTVDLHFARDERGVNLLLQMEFDAVEGLYWFDVLLNNDQLLTRVPLRVNYQRIQSGV